MCFSHCTIELRVWIEKQRERQQAEQQVAWLAGCFGWLLPLLFLACLTCFALAWRPHEVSKAGVRAAASFVRSFQNEDTMSSSSSSNKKKKQKVEAAATAAAMAGVSATEEGSVANSPAAGGTSSAAFANKRQQQRHKAALSKTSGVLEYLHKSLSRRQLLSLYATPERGRFAARAVFQRLSDLGQQVVLRLVCTGGAFTKSSISAWISTTKAAASAVAASAKSKSSSAAGNHAVTAVAEAASNKVVDRVLRELSKWAIILASSGSGDDGGTTNDVGGSKKNGNGSSNSNSSNIVQLTQEFFKSIQDTIRLLDTSPWTPLTEAQVEALAAEYKVKAPAPVTPEDLERYAQSQWDAVLHFLVGTVGVAAEPPVAVVHFLLQTGLMQNDPEFVGAKNNNNNNNNNNDQDDEAPLVITQKGYEFMLQDNVQQVWHFCVQYLLSLEQHQRGELLQEALLLLICLSFARVGDAYSAAQCLNKDGRVMMKDLAHFGLLYTRKIGKQTVFYPTRLAMQLVGTGGDDDGDDIGKSSSSSSRSARWSLSSKALESALAHPTPHDSAHLAIIVQTNFQLCAYTTSELHVSMLALFCDVTTIRRLPNIVFMVITRDSVKAAFSLGIQARQILRFLEKHAHPRLRTTSTNVAGAGTSPIPANVIDQIWLWDREQSRVVCTPVYQHECLLPGEFEAVQMYAKSRKALAYGNERRNLMFVDYRHVEKVQKFARQWRARVATMRHQQAMEE